MRPLNADDMLRRLHSAREGSVLFVSYVAGRPPKDKAIIEAARHTENPKRPRRYYLGELVRLWRSIKGDWILTMKVWNRDTLGPNGLLKEGAYRSFNPALGELILIDAIGA